MEKDTKHPSVPQPEQSGSSREQQAQAIMQQLVDEGIFAPDEAAEITFSDTQFVCVPDNGKPSDKKGVE